MENHRISLAQRRQTGLEAAESSRKLKRQQEKAQDVADRAGKQVTQVKKRQVGHEDFFSQTAGRFVKEAAELHAASIRFLNTEADVGMNLARIAAQSHNADKTARNRRRAREAYDTVLKYLPTAAPTSEELEALNKKIATLGELLNSLGERL